jgi:lysophospholipase L1-like esterase
VRCFLVLLAVSLTLLGGLLTPARPAGAQSAPAQSRGGAPAGPAGYLALGDSYAAGTGATAPAAGGYAARVAAALEARGRRRFDYVNLAVSGTTSAAFVGDFVARGRRGAGTSQLARAVQTLTGRRVDVVTLQVGGNDVLGLLAPGQPCAGELITTDACLVTAQRTLAEVTAPDLVVTVDALVRAARPGTQLVVLTYPNPLALGTGSVPELRVDFVLRGLNALLVAVVARAHPAAAGRGVKLTVVDVYPLFAGRAVALTHVLDTPPDIHPTDAGHAVIAEAVLRVLGPAAP